MRLLSFCIAFTLFLLAVPAQSAGYITGDLLYAESTGSIYPLQEADVWILDAVTAEIVTETMTDKQGHFSSGPLAAGIYKIRTKLKLFANSNCKAVFQEYLGEDFGNNRFDHSDVFDTAATFKVVEGGTTQVNREVVYFECPKITECMKRDTGLQTFVFDADSGLKLDGILVYAKDAINAMPVFEGPLVSGFHSNPGFVYWQDVTCGLPVVKLRVTDPTGEFSSEYYLDQPDDFSLGTDVDLVPFNENLQKIILERVTLPEQIDNIGDIVETLPLPENDTSSLLHTLGQAYGQLTDENPNNDKSACGTLKGFVNRLNGAVARGDLSEEERDMLSESVAKITEGLGCKN